MVQPIALEPTVAIASWRAKTDGVNMHAQETQVDVYTPASNIGMYDWRMKACCGSMLLACLIKVQLCNNASKTQWGRGKAPAILGEPLGCLPHRYSRAPAQPSSTATEVPSGP